MDDEVAETKTQVSKFIIGGLAVTIGLAWNEAIKSAIDKYFPFNNEGIKAKFLYALLLTIFLVIVTVSMIKTGLKTPKKESSCICADNDEMKRITLKLNDKIDRVIYQRGLEKTGLV